MYKILLDTDIGTDVDDAVCLAYLLAHPDCDLLGITTVTGQPELRASLASVLCAAAGKEIPIYPGFENPMTVPQKQTVAQQAAALSRWPHQDHFPKWEALGFMRRTIQANPGEVILLSIGPLTNIGWLFLEDPEIPSLLKGFVRMGGLFKHSDLVKSETEWNTSGDPHSADIAYRAPISLHRSVGMEVTQQVALTAEEVRQSFRAPLLRPVLDFAEIWFSQFYQSITFHDPLAAATIFDESLCAFERGTVTIDLQNHLGKTTWNPGETGPHQIAVSVDARRYFDHFFRSFS
jgi:inosine-uridine nucleoside N-ribohydrolase